MKRRLASLAFVVAAVMSSAMACPAPQEPVEPRPQTLEEAIAACGPDCTAITWLIDLFDEDMLPVPLSEGFEADFLLDALAQPSPNDPITQVDVWDVTKTVLVPTPYEYQYTLPLTDIQIAGPDIIQISMEVTVFLPAGWTIRCQGLEHGTVFSSHQRTNEAGITDPEDGGGPLGFPVDITVFCSWPGFIDIP